MQLLEGSTLRERLAANSRTETCEASLERLLDGLSGASPASL